MRHGDKVNNLGRTASHRRAMLSNMANSLIMEKHVITTTAKAKALRVYIEPLLTKAKNDTTHNRRVVFSYLRDKDSIKALFGEVGEKIANRPGGYTRIIKLSNKRAGDNADMALIELVDYGYTDDGLQTVSTETTEKKRTRRGGSAKKTSDKTSSEKSADKVKKPTQSKATGAPKIRQRKSGGA